MRSIALLAAVGLVLAVTGTAGATTVAFSSYGDATPEPNEVYTAWNKTSPVPEILEPVTTNDALEWALSEIKLNAYGGGILGGGSSPATVSLYQDSAGTVEIASWDININTAMGEDFSFAVSGVTLSGNTNYWFGLEATGSNAVGWRRTQSWGTAGETGYVFEISGDATVIPEPLTMAGMLLGVGCLARYVRKRRKA